MKLSYNESCMLNYMMWSMILRKILYMLTHMLHCSLRCIRLRIRLYTWNIRIPLHQYMVHQFRKM